MHVNVHGHHEQVQLRDVELWTFMCVWGGTRELEDARTSCLHSPRCLTLSFFDHRATPENLYVGIGVLSGLSPTASPSMSLV